MDGGRPGGCCFPSQKPGSGKSILQFAIRSSQIIARYREVYDGKYAKQHEESTIDFHSLWTYKEWKSTITSLRSHQSVQTRRERYVYPDSVDNFEGKAIWVRGSHTDKAPKRRF